MAIFNINNSYVELPEISQNYLDLIHPPAEGAYDFMGLCLSSFLKLQDVLQQSMLCSIPKINNDDVINNTYTRMVL